MVQFPRTQFIDIEEGKATTTMGLKDYFIPAKNMSVDEARAYLAEHKEQEFTLLDVRQPAEYEQARIPGAVLISLPELTSRLEELDREKPLVVY